MLTAMMIAFFFLALASYLSAISLASVILKETVGREAISEIVFGPLARLGPVVLVTIMMPWLIAVLGRVEEALGTVITMFILVMLPSAILAFLFSSFLLMLVASLRLWRQVLPALLAFTPPAALSIFFTFRAVNYIIGIAPSAYPYILMIFTIIMTLNGCLKPEKKAWI